MELTEELFERFLEENEKLRLYKRYMEEIFRTRKHVLSKEMEEVMAQVSQIANGPEKHFFPCLTMQIFDLELCRTKKEILWS